MFQFFEDFFKSEYVQDHIIATILMLVIFLILGAVIMWFFMTKIYMRCILNEKEDLKKKNQELNNSAEQLKLELTEVKAHMEVLLSKSKELAIFDSIVKAQKSEKDIDPALQQFIQNSK